MDPKTKDAAIFRAMLRRDNWKRFGPAVRGVLWTNTNLRTIYGHLGDLHDRTEHDLTAADAVLYLESVRPEGDAIVSLVRQFVDMAPEVSDDVLKECIRESAARGISLHAAQSILGNIHGDEFDPAIARDMLNEAVDAGKADTAADTILDLRDSGLASLELDRPNLCSLGLGDKLDYVVGGGVAAGELCIFLAGPKRGKTSLLSYIGAQAGLRGQQVMHVTLENPPQMCARRYDSALTGYDYDTLVVNSHVLPMARARITDTGGSVKIVNWQHEERSPNEIIPLVHEVGGVSVIIIDYLQLMIPDRTKGASRWERRHLFSKLGKDTCRLGAELGVPIISAWQTNRDGAAAETVSEYDVAESWDVLQHASTVIGISANEEERSIGRMRLHSLLTRYRNTPGSVRYKVNLERNQFKVDE
jgi:hypothetical protein